MADDTVTRGYEFTADEEAAHFEFWYPRVESQGSRVQALSIGLCDVRAADNIRISYDFERDGWVIKQASRFSWEADEEPDPDWQEVAFVKAFGRERPGPMEAAVRSMKGEG